MVAMLSQSGLEDEDGVRIHFVLPQGRNETTCSEDLAFAYEQATEAGLSPAWIQSDEVMELNLTKMDVFVMDPFEGTAFEVVSGSRATVVGPPCLLSCLHKKEPIPELPYPMFTAAMKGLIVTSTGFEKEEKSNMQRLVERMSGIYSNAFHDGVTHLVAAVVRSSKYSVAVDKHISIMTSEWVHQIWRSSSSNDTVSARDPPFSRYACPALMGLTISVSQMSTKDKDLLKKSIESHGGSYSKVLDMNSTNVLISANPTGDKYNYAKKWRIPILNSNWVFDSIEKGVCLETENYKVEKRSCSTPTKEENPATLSEVSLCSTIMGPGDETTTVKVDETIENAVSLLEKQQRGSANKSETWIQRLELSRVRRAGQFLEGTRIYIHGFEEGQLEHLRRVITLGGGSKVSNVVGATHSLVKSSDKGIYKDEDNIIPCVTVQWLVESMHLGRPAPESDFAPQRSMLSLPPLFTKENTDDTTQIGGRDSTSGSTMATRFLIGKTLALIGLDEDTETELSDCIEEEGGEIVSGDFEGTLDYLVLPVHGCGHHRFKARAEVNYLWMTECLDRGDLVELEFYYFKSVSVDLEARPLANVVLGISGFVSHERTFLSSLAEALGGKCQEVLIRREKGEKAKSTHLLCLAPEGNKYESALIWGLPIVSKDWILSCLEDMTWVSERPFLLGDSEVFSDGKPMPKRFNSPNVTLEEEEDQNEDEGEQTAYKTPARRLKPPEISSLETPGLDIEKMRPIKIELSPSLNVHWTPPPDSQPSPSHQAPLQRCLICSSDETEGHGLNEFHCSKMEQTPSQTYGAFLGQSDPSPHVRKFWKYHLDMVKESLVDKESEEEMMDNEEELNDSSSSKSNKDTELSYFRVLGDIIKGFNEDLHLRAREARKEPIKKMEWKKPKPVNGSSENPLGTPRARESSSKHTKPFAGVVIYVAKKCLPLFDRLSEAIGELGGSMSESYDQENVTHVIFSSQRVNDITKEFRLARSDGKFVVSPDWVFDSQSLRRLLDPTEYPHTLNALSETVHSSSNNNNSTIMSHGKKRGRRPTNVDEGHWTKNGLSTDDDSSPTKNEEGRDGSVDEDGGEITRLTEDLGRNQGCSGDPTMNNTDFQSMEIPENLTEEILLTTQETPYRFMISGFPEEVRSAFGELISSDGRFSLSESSGCDPSGTHIITPKFTSSEKLMCALASGKSFLHGSYIEDSLAQGSIILPLEPYEWERHLNALDEDSSEMELAKASIRWGLTINQRRKGAFDGFIVIIHTTPKRREAFQRLVEFGGGSVVTPLTPYTDPLNATHCLAEPHKLPKTKIDYEALATKGIAVVKAIFLNRFLAEDPPPSVDDYLVEEFEPFWKK